MSTEISQAAREAAQAEVVVTANWIPGHERPKPMGFYVQAYGDKLTAEKDAEIARVTKERDDARAVLYSIQSKAAEEAPLEAVLFESAIKQRDQLRAENAALVALVEQAKAEMLRLNEKYHICGQPQSCYCEFSFTFKALTTPASTALAEYVEPMVSALISCRHALNHISYQGRLDIRGAEMGRRALEESLSALATVQAAKDDK